MNLRNTLLSAIALCGSTMVWAGNGNAIDPAATAAVQYNVATRFGPTSAGVTCNVPASYNGTPTCASVVSFTVPNGFRFVVTNISGSVQYDQKGSNEVLEENVNLLLNVANNIVPSTIPFDHNQVVGTTTYYSFNKAVHMFIDAAVGFPEIQVDAFGNIGPFFQFGVGYMNITFQGYLVPLN